MRQIIEYQAITLILRSATWRVSKDGPWVEINGFWNYSPDFDPIEQAFAKLEALLRKAAARIVDDLSDAIAVAIEFFAPAECTNFFVNSGFEPE